MSSLDVLNEEIEELQRQLRAHKLARLALSRLQSNHDANHMAYYGKRPGEIIPKLLKDGPRRRAELTEELIKGGLIVNRKRGIHNIRISFEKLIAAGSLLENGEFVALPEQKEQLDRVQQSTISS